MANYKIFEQGKQINRIVASEAFVEEFCAARGYSYEREPDPAPEPQERRYTADDLLAVLLNMEETGSAGGG